MKVGYYDSNYFAKVFKRVTGMIPSEYREADQPMAEFWTKYSTLMTRIYGTKENPQVI